MAEQQASFLDQIPRPIRTVLLILLVVAVGYLMYQRFVGPQWLQVQNLDTQVAALEQQIGQLEGRLRAHRPVSAEERAEWQRTQARIAERIPEDYRLGDLIEELAQLAKKSNLQDALISTSEKVALLRPPELDQALRSATSGPVTSAAQARELQAQASQQLPPVHITDVISAGYFPVTITFHGKFRDQGQFLEDLARIPQLIEFDKLEINREFPETSFRVVIKAYHSGKVNRV